MEKRKKISIACLIAALLIIVGISIYAGNRSSKEAEEIIAVERHTIPTVENIFVNGSVAPKEVESFGTNLSLGTVETIHIKDGDRVSAGDRIVTYKRDGVGEQVEALEAQLEAVREAKNSSQQSPSRQGGFSREALQGLEGLEGLDGLDLEGIDLGDLGLDGDMPAMDYDAQISSLEGQIKRLRDMERSTEKSSIDGIAYIESITVQEGMNVERVLVRSEEFVAVGSVNEKNVLKLSQGMKAEITLLSDDTRLDAEIERVSQRPGSGSNMASLDINSAMMGGSSGDSLSSYEVIFKLKEHARLLEGFSIQARIPLEEDHILIPESAIELDGDQMYVYRIRDGITERVKVEAILASEQASTEGEEATGGQEAEDQGMQVEAGKALIKSGLSHGDEIVKSNLSSLSGGERVE